MWAQSATTKKFLQQLLTLKRNRLPDGRSINTVHYIVRDPIFYRWHTHIEDLAQEFRDLKFSSYKEDDLRLSEDVRKVLSQL